MLPNRCVNSRLDMSLREQRQRIGPCVLHHVESLQSAARCTLCGQRRLVAQVQHFRVGEISGDLRETRRATDAQAGRYPAAQDSAPLAHGEPPVIIGPTQAGGDSGSSAGTPAALSSLVKVSSKCLPIASAAVSPKVFSAPVLRTGARGYRGIRAPLASLVSLAASVEMIGCPRESSR